MMLMAMVCVVSSARAEAVLADRPLVREVEETRHAVAALVGTLKFHGPDVLFPSQNAASRALFPLQRQLVILERTLDAKGANPLSGPLAKPVPIHAELATLGSILIGLAAQVTPERERRAAVESEALTALSRATERAAWSIDALIDAAEAPRRVHPDVTHERAADLRRLRLAWAELGETLTALGRLHAAGSL